MKVAVRGRGGGPGCWESGRLPPMTVQQCAVISHPCLCSTSHTPRLRYISSAALLHHLLFPALNLPSRRSRWGAGLFGVCVRGRASFCDCAMQRRRLSLCRNRALSEVIMRFADENSGLFDEGWAESVRFEKLFNQVNH